MVIVYSLLPYLKPNKMNSSKMDYNQFTFYSQKIRLVSLCHSFTSCLKLIPRWLLHITVLCIWTPGIIWFSSSIHPSLRPFWPSSWPFYFSGAGSLWLHCQGKPWSVHSSRWACPCPGAPWQERKPRMESGGGERGTKRLRALKLPHGHTTEDRTQWLFSAVLILIPDLV